MINFVKGIREKISAYPVGQAEIFSEQFFISHLAQSFFLWELISLDFCFFEFFHPVTNSFLNFEHTSFISWPKSLAYKAQQTIQQKNTYSKRQYFFRLQNSFYTFFRPLRWHENAKTFIVYYNMQ